MAKKRISKKIINKVNNFRKSVENDNVSISKMFIFGSHAKGTAHEWSDIDLCVISPAFGKKIKDPLNYLWSKRLEIKDFSIEPVGFSNKEFSENSPLLFEIKKYGVRV